VRQLEGDLSIAKKFHGEMWRVSITTQQRMPMVFWSTVYFLALLSLGLAGYDLGLSKGTRKFSGWVVTLAFSSVITFVVTLDRPLASIVKQLPLLDLQAELHQSIELNK
jgi:hypothetical protein